MLPKDEFVVEYELKIGGNYLVNKVLTNEQVLEITDVVNYLKDRIGRQPCPKLRQLPEVRTSYRDSNWGVLIYCCCHEQEALVRDRIEDLLPSPS